MAISLGNAEGAGTGKKGNETGQNLQESGDDGVKQGQRELCREIPPENPGHFRKRCL